MTVSPLAEVALLFLRLGVTAFGGPAAHIALMEQEVVKRRAWLSREEFLDLLGATNLIPGPNSTEMAIHIGYRRAGWPGLLAAGACFILPAAALTYAFGWAYVRFGRLPQAAALLYGVKPIIIAIVFLALVRLARTAVRSVFAGVLAAACVAASAFGVNELAVLAAAGAVAAAAHAVRRGETRTLAFLLPATTTATVTAAPLAGLFLTFLKIGSVLFGSGYVLLAFLRADLVDHYHWLTSAQLLDAVAVGQITPGPVFTTATFIGYLVHGTSGAALATLGIFLPAFVFVALSGPLVLRIRRSPTAGAFLDGVIIASLALMAVVTFELGRSAIVDLPTAALAVLSTVLLAKKGPAGRPTGPA